MTRRWPELALLLGALCLTAFAVGCDANQPVAILPGPTSGFCQGVGPAIIVGDGITRGEADGTTDDVCSGAIARRTFRFALCLCEGYATSTALVTDSFASGDGPYQAATAGAAGSVGVNGELRANANLDVSGSLWAGDQAGEVGALLDIAGDLQHQGGLSGGGTVIVGHDATVQGPVSLTSLQVAGRLVVPALADVSTSGPLTYGALTEAVVTVPDPCACASDELVDVTRFINLHVDDNDNLASGLSKSALAGFTGDATLDLPCGRYYLDSIDGSPGAELTIRARGRVVLFVGGNVNLRGPMRMTLDPDAEFDLFVGGLLMSDDAIEFGDVARPSKARLYVGGSGQMNLSGNSVFAGNLYAPQASLALSAQVELFGSLFLRSLTQAAPVTIHYDTDVLAADEGCPATSGLCESCLDCPAQACNAGTCGPCATSADCCAPLVCSSGACVPET